MALSWVRSKHIKMKALAQKMVFLAIGVDFLLLVPMVAMRFTDEVELSVADFGTEAVLLFCAGSAYVAITHSAPERLLLIAFTAIFVLAVVWAELALGVLGKLWAGS